MKALFRRKSPPPESSRAEPNPSSRRRRRHSTAKHPHTSHHRPQRRRRKDYLPPPYYSPTSPLLPQPPSGFNSSRLNRYPSFPPPPPFHPRASFPPYDYPRTRSTSRNRGQRRRRVVSPSPSPPPPSIGRTPTPGPPTARALASKSQTEVDEGSTITRDHLLDEEEEEDSHFDHLEPLDPIETNRQRHSFRSGETLLDTHPPDTGHPFPPRARSRSQTRGIGSAPNPSDVPFPPGPLPPYASAPVPHPPLGAPHPSWNRPPPADFYPLHPLSPRFRGRRSFPPQPFPPDRRFPLDPHSAGSRLPYPPGHPLRPSASYPERLPPQPPFHRPSPEEELEQEYLATRERELEEDHPLSETGHHSPPPDSLSGASSYSHIQRSAAHSPEVMPRGYNEGMEPPPGAMDEAPMMGYDPRMEEPYRSHSAGGYSRGHSRGRSRSRSHSRPRSHSRGRSHSRERSRSRSRSAHLRRAHSVDRMSFASTADPAYYAHRARQFDRNHPDLLFPGAAAAYMGAGGYDPYMNMPPGGMPGPYGGYGMMPGAPSYPYSTPHPGAFFQGDTPGLVFQSARPFLLYVTGPDLRAVADSEAPWLQLTEEHDGRPVLSASLRGDIISMFSDSMGELLSLTKFPPSASRRGLGGRVVIGGRSGEPLLSAIVPGSRAFAMQNQGMYGGGYMGDMYRNDRHMGGGFGPMGPYGDYYNSGQRFADQLGNAWNTAGDYMMNGVDAFQQHAMSQIGPYAAFGAGAANAWGFNPYGNRSSGYGGMYGDYSPYGNSMYGRRGTPGDIDPEFMRRYNPGGYGRGYGDMGGYGEAALADFHPSDKVLKVSSRRKRMPVMRLVRARDGVREILQTDSGYEVASFALAQGSGAAGMEGDGFTYRLVVQPGMDVAMVVAAIASHLWISSEMNMSGMNMSGMNMPGMPAMGMGY